MRQYKKERVIYDSRWRRNRDNSRKYQISNQKGIWKKNHEGGKRKLFILKF